MWLSCFHGDQRKGWGDAGYPKDFQGGLKICRTEASRALSLVTVPSSSDWSASWRPAGPWLPATRASLTCSPGHPRSQGWKGLGDPCREDVGGGLPQCVKETLRP